MSRRAILIDPRLETRRAGWSWSTLGFRYRKSFVVNGRWGCRHRHFLLESVRARSDHSRERGRSASRVGVPTQPNRSSTEKLLPQSIENHARYASVFSQVRLGASIDIAQSSSVSAMAQRGTPSREAAASGTIPEAVTLS